MLQDQLKEKTAENKSLKKELKGEKAEAQKLSGQVVQLEVQLTAQKITELALRNDRDDFQQKLMEKEASEEVSRMVVYAC